MKDHDRVAFSKPLIYLILVFFLSRLLFIHNGIHFDASSLDTLWQVIDVDLLRTDLLSSIFFLHSQPPLFNVYLGSILKLFPNNEVLFFNLTYILFGLILTISIYTLMVRLGVSKELSAVITFLFIVSPSCILYENWLFYTYPIATLFCLTALFLNRFLSDERFSDGFIFFALLASLVLIRSIFHILWFLFFFIVLLSFKRRVWKKIVLVALIPFLIIFLLYMKNLIIFGSFTTSTWFGMNFFKIASYGISDKELQTLTVEGRISNISVIPPFSSIESYESHLKNIGKTDVLILDQKVKSSGHPNFNNIGYIPISKQYFKDAKYLVISDFRGYWNNIRKSYAYYLKPSHEYWLLSKNRVHIPQLERFYSTFLYGRMSYKQPHHELDGEDYIKYFKQIFLNNWIFLVFGFHIIVFYGLFLTMSAFSKKPVNISFTLTILFIWINIIYITVLVNFFEIGENNRFRFLIEPFLVVILGLIINNEVKKIKRK